MMPTGVYRKVRGHTGVGMLYQFLHLARHHTSGVEMVVYIPLRIEPEWAGTVRPCVIERFDFEQKFEYVGEGLPAASKFDTSSQQKPAEAMRSVATYCHHCDNWHSGVHRESDSDHFKEKPTMTITATHPRATGDQGQYPPRVVEDHFDGHGLTESLRIECDGPGPGGASHHYVVFVSGATHDDSDEVVASIQFQEGPRLVEGSIPGIVEGVLYAILIDRLRAFQAGPYSCRENAIQLTHLEEALMWAKERAHARAKRGVLGTMQK